jgi:hypothetical protein
MRVVYNMYTVDVPEPEEVYGDLKDVIMMVGEVLEAAIAHAHEYFDDQGVDPEPFHFSSTVRFKACQLLKAQMYDAAYEPETVPNNGISLKVDRYKLKVRKCIDGALPPPGPSQKNQDFYTQPVQMSLFPDPMDRDMQGPDRHVFLLWERDHSFHLSNLTLVYPRWGDEHSAAEHWRLSIEHPAVIQGRELAAQAEADDALDEIDEDLWLEDGTDERGLERDQESQW